MVAMGVYICADELGGGNNASRILQKDDRVIRSMAIRNMYGRRIGKIEVVYSLI